MLVYRLCSRGEVNYILSTRTFNGIGGFGYEYRYNTHKYLTGRRYMHFFLDKNNVTYMEYNKDRCICVYDIPEDILNRYIGSGRYAYFFDFDEVKDVVEFAICSDEMLFDYLRKAYLINKYIDFEDCFVRDLDTSLFETIYDASKNMSRQRKKEEVSS